jgi:hypothetical protein
MGHEKCVQNFCQRKLKGRDHTEDLGVDGRITFRMGLREIRWETVDWICVAQDTDHCPALVNRVMNLLVP